MVTEKGLKMASAQRREVEEERKRREKERQEFKAAQELERLVITTHTVCERHNGLHSF